MQTRYAKSFQLGIQMNKMFFYQVAQNLSKANYGPAPIDLLQFVFTSLEPEVIFLDKFKT